VTPVVVTPGRVIVAVVSVGTRSPFAGWLSTNAAATPAKPLSASNPNPRRLRAAPPVPETRDAVGRIRPAENYPAATETPSLPSLL
jgi:hypothetical protein